MKIASVAALILVITGLFVASHFSSSLTTAASSCDQAPPPAGQAGDFLRQVSEASKNVTSVRIQTGVRSVRQAEGGPPLELILYWDLKKMPAGSHGIHVAYLEGLSEPETEVFFQPEPDGRQFERTPAGGWRELKDPVITETYEQENPLWECYPSEVSIIGDTESTMRVRMITRSVDDRATDIVTVAEVRKHDMLLLEKVSTWREFTRIQGRLITNDYERVCLYSEFGAAFEFPADLPLPRP